MDINRRNTNIRMGKGDAYRPQKSYDVLGDEPAQRIEYNNQLQKERQKSYLNQQVYDGQRGVEVSTL